MVPNQITTKDKDDLIEKKLFLNDHILL